MNGNWIDRINKMEATPPENGWDKIAVALDESLIEASFPSKLYNSEINPPSNVWSAITRELDGESVPVISLPKRNIVPIILRYAVAACLAGLIAFGAFRFLGKSGNNQVATAGIDTTKAPVSNEPVIVSDAAEDDQKNKQLEDEDEEALEQSKLTYAKLDLPKRSSTNKLYKSPAKLASFAVETSARTPEIQYSHRAAVTDSPVEETDRYAMYQDTDGRFIRISKKLAELFCCVSGEVKDDDCNTQLKEWRQKIASSPFNPSPDNFMDILDLINSIQDNRN